MAHKSQSSLVRQIDKLLEKEHLALSEGRLDELVKLIDQKQALVNALAEVPPEAGAPLNELQAKAARNQAMLDGALRGIKSVSTRLATLRKVRESLQSYDEQGRRKTINTATENKLEKRA